MKSKPKAVLIFALAVGMMGGGVLLLVKFRQVQRLGPPGVRLSPEPCVNEKGQPVGSQSIFLPPALTGASSSNMPITKTELDMLPPDTTFGRRIYQWPDGFTVITSAVLMGSDRTSIHQAQYCLIGQGWDIDQTESISIPVQGSSPFRVPAIKLTLSRRITKEGQSYKLNSYFIYWYISDRQVIPSRAGRMWSSSLRLLKSGELERWAYVAFMSNYLPGQEQTALERMLKAIAEAVPQFQVTRP
jgi:hypothetical protein